MIYIKGIKFFKNLAKKVEYVSNINATLLPLPGEIKGVDYVGLQGFDMYVDRLHRTEHQKQTEL